MNHETSKEIELAVARWFGIRKYVIVPNVSWGFLPYEADLLLLTRSGCIWEVEIKVSHSDLLKDKKKRHNHDSDKVRQLWFAIPERLLVYVLHIPERAGIIVVKKDGKVLRYRVPISNLHARPLSDDDRFQLARLGALRIWPLKEKIAKMTIASSQHNHAKT